MSHSPPTPSSPIDSGNRGLAALSTIKTLDATPTQAYRSKSWTTRLPPISATRLAQSPAPSTPSAVLPSEKPPSTILYLAYGSNLSAETFQGNRGIHPLAATNVVVPSLVLTFDLPGLPYSEPCFANTAFRTPPPPPPSPSPPLSSSSPPLPPIQTYLPATANATDDEKTPFLSPRHNHQPELPWPHGLVGVVYEVTPADYAHIIATEGGGASYTDITIPCHPLPRGTARVPDHPTTPPFLAHTLFAPADDPPPDAPIAADETAKAEQAGNVGMKGRLTRPGPHHAQPSPRYLALITTGAAEHAFPPDYTAYLHSLHPYLITSTRQRLGQFIFLGIWGPIVAAVFMLAKLAGRGKGDGKSPRWVVWLTGKLFESMWRFYDGGFKEVFGEGERTEEKGGRGGEGEGV